MSGQKHKHDEDPPVERSVLAKTSAGSAASSTAAAAGKDAKSAIDVETEEDFDAVCNAVDYAAAASASPAKAKAIKDQHDEYQKMIAEIFAVAESKRQQQQVPNGGGSGGAPAVASASGSASHLPILVKDKRVEFTESQKAALDVLLSGKNVFMSGEAGAGKTTIVCEFIRREEDAGRMVIPTALVSLAATNMEGAMTSHKFFGVGICKDSLKQLAEAAVRERVAYYKESNNVRRLEAEAVQLMKNGAPHDEVMAKSRDAGRARAKMERSFTHMRMHCSAVIIDEFGVARPSDYEKMLVKLKVLRAAQEKPLPQLIHTGDMFQSRPINPRPKDTATELEKEEYQQNKQLILNTNTWTDLNAEIIHLHEVFRQKDKTQQEILGRVRIAALKASDLEFLKSLIHTKSQIETSIDKAKAAAEAKGEVYHSPVYLSALKADVRAENTKRLKQLPTSELRFATQVYYAKRDPETGRIWHRKVYVESASQKQDENRIRDFRFEHGDPIRRPISEKERGKFCYEPMTQGRLTMLKKEILQTIDNLQIEPFVVTKVGASILFTRELVPKKVVNGTRGRILEAKGFEEYEKKNGISSLPPLSPPTDFIKLEYGPVPDDVYLPSVKASAMGLETDIHVHPIDYEYPCDPSERKLKPKEWTSWFVIRAAPWITGWAVTIQKTIGMQFKQLIFNAGSIRAHGSPQGLFYLGLSRCEDLNEVKLLNFDEQVIESRVSVIRYFRKQLPFFSSMDDDEFEDAIEQGRLDAHLPEHQRDEDPGFRLILPEEEESATEPAAASGSGAGGEPAKPVSA